MEGGSENRADGASRYLYPAELLQHSLWWDGPRWLEQSSSNWPIQGSLQPNASTDEEREIVLLVVDTHISPVIPIDRISSYVHLNRVTSWILRYCRSRNPPDRISTPLTKFELEQAEIIGSSTFKLATSRLTLSVSNTRSLPNSSSLISLNPFMDFYGVLRVGG